MTTNHALRKLLLGNEYENFLLLTFTDKIRSDCYQSLNFVTSNVEGNLHRQ